MWPNSPFAIPRGSFERPVPIPTNEPDAAPTKTLNINCQWLPYIRGALQQLLLETTWDETTGDPDLAQQRAFNLIDLFQECSSSGVPIACNFDYSATNSPEGWQIFCDIPHGCFGTFNVNRFQSTPGIPGPWQQLQFFSPHLNRKVVNFDMFYESSQDIRIDILDYNGSSASLVDGPTFWPASSFGHALVEVDVVIDMLRLVVSNQPQDAGHAALITVPRVVVTMIADDGPCP